nr:nodulation protein W, putative [Tanacetum cinerariifolium]
VTADQLTALQAGSGSSVKAQGDIDADSFQLDISSGAAVKADISTATLAVRQSSGSTADVSGRATSIDIQSSSGSSFAAADLKTDHARAEASSGSSIQLAVKDDLVAQASSGGSINYKGSPQLTKRTSSGGSLILLDMNFAATTTGADGLALLAEFKALAPQVPVILLTGWGSIALAVAGMKAGAAEFVTKPWQNETLLQTIGTILQLHAPA